MNYPADMTQEDIMEFEYEYNRIRDIEEGIGFWEVNAELAELAEADLVDSAADTFMESL